jgi:hypothetical protein
MSPFTSERGFTLPESLRIWRLRGGDQRYFADASIAAAVADRDRFCAASLAWGSGYGARTVGRSRTRRTPRLALVLTRFGTFPTRRRRRQPASDNAQHRARLPREVLSRDAVVAGTARRAGISRCPVRGASEAEWCFAVVPF